MPGRVIRVVGAVAVVTAAAWSSSPPVGARVPAAGVQVQLLDPGATPRTMLRLGSSSAATSRTVTFSTQVTQSGLSNATVGPLQIQAVVSILASPPGPRGTIRVPYTYGQFQLLDSSAGTQQELDSVRTSLAQFQGFSGEYTLSPTGDVLSNRFHIPPAVNATVRSVLQRLSDQSGQLTVPLPTQPVGIGAHWRGTTQLVAGGIHFRQTYDYTLRSRDGARLTLDVRYTQIAPRQQIKPAGVPAGVTVDVINFRTTGMGVSGVDLSQAIPVSGHITAQGVERLRFRQGGRSERLDQQLQLGVDITAG